MTHSITFESFNTFFQQLNSSAILNDKLKNQFYDLIPNLFNYEEEGEKLNFDILFLKDIDQNKKLLPSFIFQEIIHQELEKFSLRKAIKSIAPFSKNGWSLFVSTDDLKVTVGIYKNLSGIASLDISSILSKDDFFQVEKIDSSKILFFNSQDSFLLHISVTQAMQTFNKKENIKSLVALFTKDTEHDHKDKFVENISNVLFHNLDKIHGTILCIQDKDSLVDEFLQKGIFFEKPINLFEEYLNFISNCSMDENIAERYYSFVGILSVILNIDGLTLINTNGEILGYNIFIDNKNVDTSTVTGGARKRAAYSIEHSKIEGLSGIYFQSHDGDNYFKELSHE